MSRSSRRAFIGTLGAAAAALPGFRSTLSAGDAGAAAPAAMQAKASYDLVITGGRVIDPSQNLAAERDVAIANGKIAAVAANIPATQAREVFSHFRRGFAITREHEVVQLIQRRREHSDVRAAELPEHFRKRRNFRNRRQQDHAIKLLSSNELAKYERRV